MVTPEILPTPPPPPVTVRVIGTFWGDWRGAKGAVMEVGEKVMFALYVPGARPPVYASVAVSGEPFTTPFGSVFAAGVIESQLFALAGLIAAVHPSSEPSAVLVL
jgi:hypothetical protein